MTLTGPVGVDVGRISAASSGNTSPPDRISRHRDESHRREPLSFIGRINSVPTEKMPGGADAYRAYGSRCSRCRPDKRSAIRQCLTARPNYRRGGVHRREPLSFCQSDKLRANRQKCPVALTLTGPVGIAVVVVGRISAAPSGNTSPPDRIFRHRDESHRREPLSFIGRINSVPTEKNARWR
jgi:hypothetical protein